MCVIWHYRIGEWNLVRMCVLDSINRKNQNAGLGWRSAFADSAIRSVLLLDIDIQLSGAGLDLVLQVRFLGMAILVW